MSEFFRLPLIGGPNKPSSSSLMPIDDAYMRRPDDTAPKLFQLLPDSSHVPPAYTLAGGQSDHVNDDDDTWHGNALEPSHATTALYTPDGQCEYQPRVLACRLCLLENTHEFATDITEYHESKVADEFGEEKRELYTDWVDSSFTQTIVNGFKRTVFTIRKPVMTAHIPAQQQASRPVLVMAFTLQSTPWGCIETGAFFSPDPEPGAGRTAVTDLADTLSQPKVTGEWPHLYDRSVDTNQLVSDAKAIIAKLTEQPTEYQDEPGAVLSNLIDRVQAECGITRQEVYKVLDILEAKGAIRRDTTGIIQLAGESQ